jgi:hypothetical protein
MGQGWLQVERWKLRLIQRTVHKKRVQVSRLMLSELDLSCKPAQSGKFFNYDAHE